MDYLLTFCRQCSVVNGKKNIGNMTPCEKIAQWPQFFFRQDRNFDVSVLVYGVFLGMGGRENSWLSIFSK